MIYISEENVRKPIIETDLLHTTVDIDYVQSIDYIFIILHAPPVSMGA